MIQFNDTIEIKMPLVKANLLCSALHLAAIELKDKDSQTSENLSQFRELILNQLNQLDFSENEELVDQINAGINHCIGIKHNLYQQVLHDCSVCINEWKKENNGPLSIEAGDYVNHCYNYGGSKLHDDIDELMEDLDDDTENTITAALERELIKINFSDNEEFL